MGLSFEDVGLFLSFSERFRLAKRYLYTRGISQSKQP